MVVSCSMASLTTSGHAATKMLAGAIIQAAAVPGRKYLECVDHAGAEELAEVYKYLAKGALSGVVNVPELPPSGTLKDPTPHVTFMEKTYSRSLLTAWLLSAVEHQRLAI